jgi:hypothetical protein
MNHIPFAGIEYFWGMRMGKKLMQCFKPLRDRILELFYGFFRIFWKNSVFSYAKQL